MSYTFGFGFGPARSKFSVSNSGTWTAANGGLLGSQVRASTLTRMYTVHTTEPGYPMRTVYRLSRPYADHAYQLHHSQTTSPGWRGF